MTGQEQAQRVIERMTRRQPPRYERYPLLDVVFDNFGHGLRNALRRFSGDGAQLGQPAARSASFGEYCHALAPGALLGVFEVEQWGRAGLVVLDSQLVDAVIDMLLGGSGMAASPPEPRTYTPTDRTLAARLIRLALGELDRALSEADEAIGPISSRLLRMEVSPQFAPITRERGAVALASFELTLKADGCGGRLEIVLPYATLEPVRPALLNTFRGDRSSKDGRWARHLIATLPVTTVPLRAVIDRLTLPLSDMARWQVGTIVPLNADADHPVTVYSADEDGAAPPHLVFKGRLGATRGRRAVRVAEVVGNQPHHLDEEVGSCRSSIS